VFYSVPKTGTGFLVPVFGTGFWYMCHWHYSTLHVFYASDSHGAKSTNCHDVPKRYDSPMRLDEHCGEIEYMGAKVIQ